MTFKESFKEPFCWGSKGIFWFTSVLYVLFLLGPLQFHPKTVTKIMCRKQVSFYMAYTTFLCRAFRTLRVAAVWFLTFLVCLIIHASLVLRWQALWHYTLAKSIYERNQISFVCLGDTALEVLIGERAVNTFSSYLKVFLCLVLFYYLPTAQNDPKKHFRSKHKKQKMQTLIKGYS